MELSRLFAYSVAPQRTTSGSPQAPGGRVTLSKEIKDALRVNLIRARLETRTAVDFVVDQTSRTNGIRDAVIALALGRADKAEQAADALALRLAGAMDQRSAPCLFVPAVFNEGERRWTTLWTFPRDEALQFRQGREEIVIEVLTEVFSQRSQLRKAARFGGTEAVRTQFLRGHIYDLQSAHAAGEAAEFWLKFLACQRSIGSDTGSRMLAQVVRRVHDQCSEVADKEQLFAAVVAVRNRPNRNVSMKDFADSYLHGTPRRLFLQEIAKDPNAGSSFTFARAAFDATLQFRILGLNTGVFVSTPLSEVNASVKISDGPERHLSCEGTIVEDKLRRRHV